LQGDEPDDEDSAALGPEYAESAAAEVHARVEVCALSSGSEMSFALTSDMACLTWYTYTDLLLIRMRWRLDPLLVPNIIQDGSHMRLQLIKSMKASLVKQTADALKACQAAAKPAKPAKGAAGMKKGENDAVGFIVAKPAVAI
jgi:hypothetical protein